jgi:transcription initiation factor IIE alpha subunit
MSPKRTINANEVVKDILSGLTDDDLMQRYGVSPEELDSLLRHLVDSDLMTQQQLEEREQLSHSQIIKAFVESREDAEKLD